MFKIAKKYIAMILLTFLVISSAGCTNTQSNATKLSFTTGKYTATAKGFNGDIQLEVSVSESAITEITVVTANETQGIGDVALEKLIEGVKTNQSLGIDSITGATGTSTGFFNAMEDALTQAGGDINTLKKNVSKTGVDETLTTEIVVVGGGASGTAAALQASENGANVILVEMTATPAGQATMAGGLFATSSTQQKEQGKTVNDKWIYDQFMVTGNYQVNGGLLSNIIKNSGSTADWLIENGAQLTLAHPGTGGYLEHRQTHPSSTLHGYTEGGTTAITNLHQSIVNNGGTILYSTKATELILEDGIVAGIKAEKEDGGILTIKADAVILATGGFGGNEALVEQTFGEGFGKSRVGTNIGTGIEMAMQAGADASLDDAITMHYGVSRGGTNWTTPLNSALLNPFLHVDVDGNRFMNEEAFIYEPIKSSNVIKSLPQRTAYEIFDETMIEIVAKDGVIGLSDVFGGELANNPTKFVEVGHVVDTQASYEKSIIPTDLTQAIEECIEKGTIVKADSVEELAEKLGMNYLVETVERYNELCDNQEDVDHFKDSSYLDKLEGTLYAVKITPSVFLGTLGGVEVNSNCEVLDINGKPIKGLYAAGSDTNGAYGNSYVYFEGGTLGYAYGSGRIAGDTAVKKLK